MSSPKQPIVWRSVEEEMKESYLRYSMSVIISRALPDVRDGLKPSQRRILYAMRQLNLTPNAKHRKCAKISGDTSGDYHPHGEQVIYPTLARLAQSWAMRYTLIEGQGNFGSIDGDPPAAMRYTEARLTSSSVHLMDDLDKDTVDMVPNYDDTKLEPVVFPAKFPNLLANGCTGIAVGMATNIPPHNLPELIKATKLVLSNRLISIEEILKVMPGPDFPTGATIVGLKGIKDAFETGRGKLILRAKWHVEELENERQAIVVDELPYNVNKARLVEHIASLVNDKEITGISDLRDESDKDGIRVVFELKRNEQPEVIINQLFKFSDMQVTFGCNMLVLERGLPRTSNIRQIISGWIDHRIEVVRRRTRYELNKAEERAHIVEGFLKAIDQLDKIVALIRNSENREDAKRQLIEGFGFTAKQAHAILELRLYQLTGLEQDNLHNEFDQLNIKINHFKAVLADEELVKGIISDELDLVLKNHNDPRRSEIVVDEASEVEMEDLIANEQVVITLSEDDYIKRMPVDTFREQRRGGQGVVGMQLKNEDAVKDVYSASTHDYLFLVSNLGRCFWIKVWQIPDTGRRSKGKPLVQLIEDLQEGEKIATVLCIKDVTTLGSILIATKKGIVKKTELSAFNVRRRRGLLAIVIDEGDEVIAARVVQENHQVMLFTRNGMAVRFPEEEIRATGRVTRGVIGVRLKDEKDYVVGCEAVTPDQNILVVCENGFGKRTLVEEFRQTSRGAQGVRSIITSDRNGLVVGALSVKDPDGLILISSSGQTIRISIDQLRVMGRTTQGVRLVTLKDQDILVAIQKIENSLDENDSISSNEASEITQPIESESSSEPSEST